MLLGVLFCSAEAQSAGLSLFSPYAALKTQNTHVKSDNI